jgi:hypothetical protein
MKPFTAIASVVFALVATLQLVRFLQGWPISIDGVEIPVWASGIACVISATLSVMVWRERRQ